MWPFYVSGTSGTPEDHQKEEEYGSGDDAEGLGLHRSDQDIHLTVLTNLAGLVILYGVNAAANAMGQCQ